MAKIRTSFVTNSSSSSYILAIKGEENSCDCRFAKAFYNIFKALSPYKTWKTEEEWTKYCTQDYEDSVEILKEDSEWAYERYIEGLELLKQGYIIYEYDIDYNEEKLAEVLSTIPDGEHIIMIKDGD